MRKWAPLLVTLTLVAALAAVAVPNLYLARERSRQKRTMADMRSIATALEARATDVKEYNFGPIRPHPPGTMHRVLHADLERALVPVYIRKLPLLDGWGQPIRVYVGRYDEKGHARDYLIRSFGSDERADQSRYAIGQTSTFEQDLVFAQGNFIRYPEGT